MESLHSKSDLPLVLELIKHAREHGITEIQFGELRVKISSRAQETGSGPVSVSNSPKPAPLTWGSTLPSLLTEE